MTACLSRLANDTTEIRLTRVWKECPDLPCGLCRSAHARLLLRSDGSQTLKRETLRRREECGTRSTCSVYTEFQERIQNEMGPRVGRTLSRHCQYE